MIENRFSAIKNIFIALSLQTRDNSVIKLSLAFPNFFASTLWVTARILLKATRILRETAKSLRPTAKQCTWARHSSLWLVTLVTNNSLGSKTFHNSTPLCSSASRATPTRSSAICTSPKPMSRISPLDLNKLKPIKFHSILFSTNLVSFSLSASSGNNNDHRIIFYVLLSLPFLCRSVQFGEWKTLNYYEQSLF